MSAFAKMDRLRRCRPSHSIHPCTRTLVDASFESLTYRITNIVPLQVTLTTKVFANLFHAINAARDPLELLLLCRVAEVSLQYDWSALTKCAFASCASLMHLQPRRANCNVRTL